ncbi:MAG: glycosyltransferase [Verrucomicrobia bacterium]|nr:glycosyltransferase [Verrucomicrobiota bacterium]
MKISLCLLVWNELEGCKIDIPNLPREEFHEVYAVDGGSTDGTVEYLEAQGIPVYQQPKKGLNNGYRHAHEIAKGDAVVVFFPKGTIPPKDLLKFKEYFKEGFELVIASRQGKGSQNEEDDKVLRFRKWAVYLLGGISALIWKREGYWVRDVLHGIKGWKKTCFNKMNILDHGLSIDIEMVIRAYKLKIPRIEFPTTEVARVYGETNFKMWPTGKKLASYLWFELWRKE